jgi:arylsulfatase A
MPNSRVIRLLCLGLLFSTLAATCIAESSKPNIIFIMADDQGFGDVSALNPKSKIRTPNIDRIASEGMIFSDGHSSSSVCTPTRYSVLTGRYHWRTTLQRGVLGGFSKPLISPGRLTVASLLKEQGYSTGCFGKWHLGWDWPLKDGGTADDRGDFSGNFKGGWAVDYTGQIKNGPCDLGFDSFFGISASLDMPPYVYVRDRTPTEPATVEKAFHRKGPAAAGFEAVDVLPKITAETVKFINDQAKSDKPFFVYFPLNAPHTPIVPTAEWEGKSGINKYGDFTMQVDWTVGQVLKAIDDNGIADNTLVIFTTDNGCSPAANIPELEAAGHDQNHIYRGHKADIFEGGHRVPFLARWPGKVKAGSRTDQLVGQLDLLATAADIVGVTFDEAGGEDSVSFLPVLLGRVTAPIRTSIVSQSIGGQFAVRDGQWKLCLCPGSGGWSSPRPGKADMATMPPIQLFDLAADPGEAKNLQGEHPDRVENMKEILSQIINNGRSTPGPKLDNDVPIVMIKPIPKSKAKPK